MKSAFLDATTELSFQGPTKGIDAYLAKLSFKDILGRERKYESVVKLPKSGKYTTRASFTAISFIEILFGIVQEVQYNTIKVLKNDSTTVVVTNFRQFDFSIGDPVYLVEKVSLDPEGSSEMFYAILPYCKDIPVELLKLQSVNLDVLDEQGDIIYRLISDPIHEGLNYDQNMAT